MITAKDLQDQRAIQNGESPKEKDGRKTENVVKFFMDADKIAAIKAMDTRITVGTPPTQIVIKPMSPLGIAQSYSLIRKLLVPIISVVSLQQQGRSIPFDQFLEAFGDNIDLLPELIYNIIRRGNADITREWCDEHLDFMLDVQLILPLFLEQNGLDKLFSGKKQAGSGEAAAPPIEQPAAQKTEASPEVSISSADITVGV